MQLSAKICGGMFAHNTCGKNFFHYPCFPSKIYGPCMTKCNQQFSEPKKNKRSFNTCLTMITYNDNEGDNDDD